MSVTHTRAVSCGWILDIFRNYSKQDFQIFLTMPVDQCKKMVVFTGRIHPSIRNVSQIACAKSGISLAYVTKKFIGSINFSMAGSHSWIQFQV